MGTISRRSCRSWTFLKERMGLALMILGDSGAGAARSLGLVIAGDLGSVSGRMWRGTDVWVRPWAT